MRRGPGTKFLPSKLLPGEWAVVLSDDPSTGGRAVYVCFSAGTVKRMITQEDMANEIVMACQDIIDQLTEGVDEATEEAETAVTNANSATTRANNAATAANDAATSANDAAGTATAAATSATGAATSANEAAGRANGAADEAEAFLKGFVVEYDNLSDECKAYIAESAAAGATFLTKEQGVAIVDAMADVIASGRSVGFLSREQGLEIIDDIFG